MKEKNIFLEKMELKMRQRNLKKPFLGDIPISEIASSSDKGAPSRFK